MKWNKKKKIQMHVFRERLNGGWCFHLLIMSSYVYIKNGSTRNTLMILCHHGSTVAQSVDIVGVVSLHADITAKKM